MSFSLVSKDSNLANRFITNIIEFEGKNPNNLYKWKDYDNQVVIRSDNYFYKIYQTTYTTQFFCAIREALAKIYREQFGLVWNTQTIYDKEKGSIYQIEQREKLEVCTPEKISYEDLFLDWSNTLELLEAELGLKEIELQLREYFPQMKRLKIVRDCVNKFEDYAFKNGKIVLLDDADFFLAMVDKDGNWLNPTQNVINITYKGNDVLFAPFDFFNIKIEDDALSFLGNKSYQWMMFYHSGKIDDTQKVIANLKSLRHNMLEQNIKMLATKQPQHLYISGNLKRKGFLNQGQLLETAFRKQLEEKH